MNLQWFTWVSLLGLHVEITYKVEWYTYPEQNRTMVMNITSMNIIHFGWLQHILPVKLSCIAATHHPKRFHFIFRYHLVVSLILIACLHRV